jgi:hypothetical protein
MHMRANESQKRSLSATTRLSSARRPDLAQLAFDVVEVALAMDTPASAIQQIMAAIARESRSPHPAQWRAICKHVAILITRYYAQTASGELIYFAEKSTLRRLQRIVCDNIGVLLLGA